MSENRGVGTLGNVPNHIDGIGGADDMTTPISKRTTSPAFQFYPSDFLASANVDEMSMTERGAYITLLSRAWLDNGLPTDLAQLARYVRMKPAQFERMWKSGPLGRCFEEKGGRFVSPRQERERRKQAEYRRRQSDNGKLGGRPNRNPPLNPEEAKPFAEESGGKACAKRREEMSREETRSLQEEGSGETKLPPMDIWTRELVNLYPAQGRCGWNLVERPLFGVLTDDPAVPYAEAWAALKVRLEQQKRSAQWKAGKIPRLDRWLTQGLHLQELPEVELVQPVVDTRTPAWLR